MTDIWVLYSTFPNRTEALSVARLLVKQKAVACANIFDNILSVYSWEGQVEESPEVILIAKTSQSALDRAMTLIQSNHSYDVPCITAWPASQGLPAYLQWVADETLPPAPPK